jgi:hypothetical protein
VSTNGPALSSQYNGGSGAGGQGNGTVGTLTNAESKSIEEAIEEIERTIQKLKDASSDGKDDTLTEVARRAKVIADAGGYRRPDVEQMPEVYRRALEDLETSKILTLSSGLQWARYYVIPGEGWDQGVGDAWMRMEAERLELLRRRIEVIQGKRP